MTKTILTSGSNSVRGALVIVLFGTVSIVRPALAAWQFAPRVSAGVNYSNNIDLGPPGSEKSDRAIELTPGFSARYQSPRADADIDYSVQSLNYRNNNDLDETYHRLAATGSVQLVRESLLLDAGAAVRQLTTDTTAPIPTGSIAGSGNLSNEYTAYLSPRWHLRFSDNAQADVRYTAGNVRYDNGSRDDSTQQAVAAVVESIAQPERIYWATKYRQSRVDFETRDRIRFEQATIETGIPLSGALRLVLLAGEERNNFRLWDGRDAPDDSYWLAGFRSQRARRYEFELLAGDRVFGHTTSLRWIVYGRQWTTQALYNEDYVTYAETRLDINPNAPASILPGPDMSSVLPEVYLRKRGELSAKLERPKTTLRIHVYDETRKYQTIVGNDELQGADVVLAWRVSALTTLSLSGGHQKNRLLETGATDKTDLLTIGVERRFGRRTTGSLTLRRAENSSDFASREYQENSASLSATFTF